MFSLSIRNTIHEVHRLNARSWGYASVFQQNLTFTKTYRVNTRSVHLSPYTTNVSTAPCAHTIQAYGGIEVSFYLILTLALGGGKWSTSHCTNLTVLQTATRTHWIGGWVGPRSSLDVLEERKISCPCWELNPRSSTPYYINYTTPPPSYNETFLYRNFSSQTPKICTWYTIQISLWSTHFISKTFPIWKICIKKKKIKNNVWSQWALCHSVVQGGA